MNLPKVAHFQHLLYNGTRKHNKTITTKEITMKTIVKNKFIAITTMNSEQVKEFEAQDADDKPFYESKSFKQMKKNGYNSSFSVSTDKGKATVYIKIPTIVQPLFSKLFSITNSLIARADKNSTRHEYKSAKAALD